MHIFILILFLLSVCHCCLCELEAYDTKQIPCMRKHTWQYKLFLIQIFWKITNLCESI